MNIKILVTLLSLTCVQGLLFEDDCPVNISHFLSIIFGNAPNNGDEENVVYPLIGIELEGDIDLLCPRCLYRSPSNEIIMGIFFVGIVAIMVSFMLMILEVMMAYNGRNNARQEQRNAARQLLRRRARIQRERDSPQRDQPKNFIYTQLEEDSED